MHCANYEKAKFEKFPFSKDLLRRLNPGVNQITASVRATYGTAHQVRIKLQHRLFLQVGMSSSKHRLLDKKRHANEVIGAYLQLTINP